MKKYLILTFFVFSLALFAQEKVYFLQTDWSGGPGHEFFSNTNVFFDHYYVDYTTNNGLISFNSSIKNSVSVPFEYKGKIFTSTVQGLMAYDKSENTWEFTAPNIVYYLDHTILRDTLYILGMYKIFTYDGSKNDYGLGPNGFKFHSNTPTTYIFCLDAAGDYLYFGGRVGYSGCAYKYNQTLKQWVKMGGYFSDGIYCFIEYNGALYAGTHWSGAIYKWSGTNWSLFYSTGLMTVYDLKIFNGKLYACGITSGHTSGKIVDYDGTTWNTAYTGHGVRCMAIHDSKLYFSAHKSSPPGAVYAYDGTTSTQIYTLENEAYPTGLLSDNGNLYYGGIEHVYGGVNNSTLYKNGSTFYELYVRYLTSSTFSTFSGVWENLSYDTQTPANTGVNLYIMGRNNSELWGSNREFIYTPNNSPIQTTDKQIRYLAVLWSADPTSAPILEEVRINSGDYLSTRHLDYNNTIQIYPNPNNGTFNLKLAENLPKGSQIIVYNYIGKQIYNKNSIQLNANNNIEIKLTNTAAGIYVIEIVSENMKSQQKFYIQ